MVLICTALLCSLNVLADGFVCQSFIISAPATRYVDIPSPHLNLRLVSGVVLCCTMLPAYARNTGALGMQTDIQKDHHQQQQQRQRQQQWPAPAESYIHTYVHTETEAHAESKHPKSDFATCFPMASA